MDDSHRIISVQKLYEDAKYLLEKIVMGSADELIDSLEQGVAILKSSWEGSDAVTQINNVIDVTNAMIAIRNVLGNLAVDAAKIANVYREVQIANKGNNLSSLDLLRFDTKSMLERLPVDPNKSDSININPEVNNGKQKVTAASDAIQNFVTGAKSYMDAIMENWTAGPGRKNAQDAFDEFFSKSDQYKKTLQEVSTSIGTAIQNYTF